jgi:hypothetical protein
MVLRALQGKQNRTEQPTFIETPHGETEAERQRERERESGSYAHLEVELALQHVHQPQEVCGVLARVQPHYLAQQRVGRVQQRQVLGQPGQEGVGGGGLRGRGHLRQREAEA